MGYTVTEQIEAKTVEHFDSIDGLVISKVL